MADVVMAKSKGLGRGGRRKGAGRPRLTETGKTSYFSTRITPQTRARLEAESRLSGLSLSQTIERFLLFGLREKQARNQPRPIKAICYLITTLSEMMAVRVGERNSTHPEYNWRSNPFMFEAYRVAVLHLLDALRPEGEIVVPPPLTKIELPPWQGKYAKYDDPEEFGRDLTRSLLEALQFYGVTTPEEVNAAILEMHGDFASQNFLDERLRTHYGMGDAARDLGVKCYWDPQSEIDKFMANDQTP
jgi:hypothetical protein